MYFTQHCRRCCFRCFYTPLGWEISTVSFVKSHREKKTYFRKRIPCTNARAVGINKRWKLVIVRELPAFRDRMVEGPHVVLGDCSSKSDVPADENLDELVADDDNWKDRFDRTSLRPVKQEAAKLSEMMRSSFGGCDEALCRAVDVVGTYRTPLNYVSSLFTESQLIRPCTFDLSRPCQLDATSTGVQFLTLDAVRVSSVSPFSLQQHYGIVRSQGRGWPGEFGGPDPQPQQG